MTIRISCTLLDHEVFQNVPKKCTSNQQLVFFLGFNTCSIPVPRPLEWFHYSVVRTELRSVWDIHIPYIFPIHWGAGHGATEFLNHLIVFQLTCFGLNPLLRMYGAGKLLLKDTVLEMKANRRYGVVGHNGAAPRSRRRR